MASRHTRTTTTTTASSIGRKKGRRSRSSRYSKAPRPSKNDDEYHIRKSLRDYVHDDLLDQSRTLFYQRIYILAKNVVMEASRKGSAEGMTSQKDFKTEFQEELEKISKHCHKETFTDDQVTGLFLCMDTEYTLLMIEGTEDIVGVFCTELVKIVPDWWTANRVFLVEDKIDDIYFDGFICRRSAAVNTNQKFPPSTINDEHSMGAQHWAIMQRLHSVCETLATQLKEQDRAAPDDVLPGELYNKLLPEVQRIDLVLNCTRFYRNVEAFAPIYNDMSMRHEEDALIWPIPYNYTRKGIFKRSPYDVNLIFSDYGKEDKQAEVSRATQESD